MQIGSKIKSIITKHLERQTETKCTTAINHNKFRVSGSGQCHLQRFWKRKGLTYTNLPKPQNMRRLKLGHIVHEAIQNIFQEEGILIKAEGVVEDKHRRGSYDAIINIDGKIILIDIKTIYSTRNIEALYKPHYFMQAMTYKEMLPYNVDEVGILYIDMQSLEEVYIPVPGEFEQKAKDDWDILIERWEKNEQPEPQVSSYCKWCVYKDLCKQSFPDYHKK